MDFVGSHERADQLVSLYVRDPHLPQADEVRRLVDELAARLDELEHERRQLEDYRDRYIDLYDFAPLGYASLDEEGFIQEINLAGAQLLGMDRNALTGYPFVDYVDAEDIQAFRSHVRTCIEQHAEVTTELHLVVQGGFSKAVQLRSIPIEDRKHEIVICKTAIADITETKRVEEALRNSESRHRAILESSVDAIITIDQHGIIESVNPATQRLFGYTPDELIGQNVSILMPSPDRERHDTYLANYLQTGQRKIIGIGREVTARRKDGTTFPMDLSVSEMNVAGRKMFTGLVHDITDRKRAEDVLRRPATSWKSACKSAPRN